ncbi:hypothetical protein L7F22_002088 [Adiantum nelumboides]|nr:hypothetical protein [Adiantum nelumboides]
MGSTGFRLASADRASSGPVCILWDMENCPIPGDVRSDVVAGNIRMALKVHPAVDGFVTVFSAYGDFHFFPRRLREGCQRTGINLIDVPNGRKDASDKAILVDMFLFTLDNPPPCTILLISGDVDFAPALHKLGQRGYTVLLAVPAAARVASSLCNASRHVWDWPSVARGGGFVPVKALQHRHILEKKLLESHSSDDVDPEFGEDRCVHRSYTSGKKFVNGCSKYNQEQTASITRHKSGGASNMQTVVALNGEDDCNESWVQPGDIEGLKKQFVKLLKTHGGCCRVQQVVWETAFSL